MKKTWVAVIPAFLFVLDVVAFAAVENVKVSGDITVRSLTRKDYDMGSVKGTDTYNGSRFAAVNDDQKFWTTQVRLNTDADLTDNVQAQIQLLNQRDVDPPSGGGQGSGLVGGTLIAGTAPSAANDQFEVILNLANITIKEFFYAPLTLRIGRQNIQYGDGFVIGAAQLGNPDPNNTLSADEFTLFNSFDAVRATMDLEPWTLDGFAARTQENVINRGDDADVLAFNMGYDFQAYASEVEAYFVTANDASGANTLGDTFTTTEELYALGARGSIRPWERLKLAGETVFEWGEEGGATNTSQGDFTPNGRIQQNIRAWAIDTRAEYEVRELPWPSLVGAGWTWYSGEDRNESGNSGNYRPLFRGKFYSAIREFQGFFYFPGVSTTPAYTNQHQFFADISFHPFNNKDLTFFTRYLEFFFDKVPVEGRGFHLGRELDFVLSYDYTEDLTFKLINGWLFPGSYFTDDAVFTNQITENVSSATEPAMELVAEVSLAF